MAAGFSIVIKAVDNAASTINKVNKSLAELRAPAQKFNNEIKKFKDLSGLKSVETGLNRIAQSGLGVLQSLSRAVEPLAAITGIASVSGLARLVTSWGDYGQALQLSSYQTGIAARQMQELQNAGRLAGVSAETVTAAYQGLGQAMYDAIGGRNGTALGMFKQLGIEFDDGTHHVANLRKAMEQLADQVAARNGDPQAQAQILAGAGVGVGMLPFLNKGAAGMRALEAQADIHGQLTDDDIAHAQGLWKAFTNATEAAEGFGNAMSSVIGPQVQPWIDSWTKDVDELAKDLRGLAAARSESQWLKDRQASLPADKRAELDRMRDGRTAGAATTPTIGGMASWLGGAARIPWLSGLGEYLTSQGDAKPGAGGAALTTRQRAAMGFFESRGWTAAQAAGPTANIQAESGFNPFIVGDGGKAFGLGQWHPDRQADYAKLFGHTMQSVTDLQQAMREQLEFYAHELDGGGDAGARKAGILLRGAQSGRQAGAIVSRFDERPRAVADAARSRGDLAEVIAGSPDNGGKVQVDTHIRITSDGTPKTTSRATASGNAATSSPKISMPLVPAG